MSDQAFTKTLVICDPHFGRSGHSPVAIQDNLDFLHWAVDYARSWGATSCIMGGDWTDSRHSISNYTLTQSLDGLDFINRSFAQSYFLPGNHDCYYRDSRAVISIETARYLPNIQIIKDPTVIGDTTFLPWLVKDEPKTIGKAKTRYVFAHLELPGFLLNSNVEMPDGDHLAKPEQFSDCEYVFSGHLHKRQQKRVGNANIVFCGSVMPFNFGDANDAERGIMLLEFGKDPIFVAWPDQPLYSTFTVSEMLAGAERLLKPRMSVRATVDIPLDYEASQEIRDGFVKDYGLRKLELVIPPIQDGENAEMVAKIEYRTVDQVVLDGLNTVESVGLSKDRLIAIYNELVRG